MMRPRTRLQRLTAGEFIPEISLAACSLSVGCISSYRLWHDRGIALLSFASAGVAFIVLLTRAFCRNKKALGETESQSLDGILHTLYAVLTELDSGKIYGHALRICVFVRSDKSGYVHQLTNYHCDGAPYGAGRDFLSTCGIVGKAFRTGQPQYDKLRKGELAIDHLVECYGFAREEAITMRTDRKSWAAIPVGNNPSRIEAVIFLDSALAEFFGNSGSNRRKMLEAYSIGVAKFVAQSGQKQ